MAKLTKSRLLPLVGQYIGTIKNNLGGVMEGKTYRHHTIIYFKRGKVIVGKYLFLRDRMQGSKGIRQWPID